MGLDLTLIPLNRPDLGFGYTLLNCYRDYDLFAKIQELPTQETPETFQMFMAENGKLGFVHIAHDLYGKRLQTTTAPQLTQLKYYARNQEQNRAVWAYLEALDFDQRIVLYWT